MLMMSCAGGNKEPKDPSEASDVDTSEPTLTDAPIDEPDEAGLEFDEQAAETVLKRGERKVKQCSSVVADMPTGEGELEVVFDGPKGRVVEVKIGYAFADSTQQAKQCIKNAFIGEIIPPFTGQKTVTYNITLTEGK